MDDFDAIVGREFKGELLVSAGSMKQLIVAFLRLIDAAETVGAFEVWEAIGKAEPWFEANLPRMQAFIVEHQDDDANSPLYDQLMGALKAGVPALQDWMQEHRVPRIHHWVETPWGMDTSLWACKLPPERPSKLEGPRDPGC